MTAPCPLSTLGGSPTQIPGPGFKGLDFSAFKNFQINERFRMEFRSEFFNILNHPTFTLPTSGEWVLSRLVGRVISPADRLEKSGLRAILSAIRDRSSSL